MSLGPNDALSQREAAIGGGGLADTDWLDVGPKVRQLPSIVCFES
jgi:hypothetical protein